MLWNRLIETEKSVSAFRCYVPDFGSEFDDYEDDDLDDDDDDIFMDDDFNNMDEESFDLNKFEKKTQGTKRPRPTSKKPCNNSSFLYIFSDNRDLLAYATVPQWNECLVPLAKHRIIKISVAFNKEDAKQERSYVRLKIYMVKKAFVKDENVLASTLDSNESSSNSVMSMERMTDEQIQMYHIRKNFLKKLFDMLDRRSPTSLYGASTGAISGSSSEGTSKSRKLSGTEDVSSHKSRSKDDEDDLDALDDDDLDEYIIQKPVNNSIDTFVAGTSNSDEKDLEKQLEEIYEEIEKTVVDDENAPYENSDDESDVNHHNIDIPDDTLLTTDLRSYQKTAVKWMLKRERVGEDKVKTAPKLHTLFQERRFSDGTPFYFNPLHGIITKTFVPTPPEPKGGILAE